MLHGTPMTPLLVGVVDALDQRNWPAALHLALAMPTVCANLDPSYGSEGGARGYTGWFDRFVLRHMRDEAFPAPGPDTEPSHGPDFTGDACYALRCACLGGEGAEMRGRRVFVPGPQHGAAAGGVAYEFALSYPPAPDPSAAAGVGVTRIGPDGSETTSRVDVYLLCMCVAKGVLSWLGEVGDDPAVARRLSDMITVESTGATARRLRLERQATG